MISLVVCTRNRAAALGNLLASITAAGANVAEDAVEVILVDNGSTDDTAAVIAAWCETQRFRATPVHEARPGLSFARNAGLAHVTGDIVAMTDDDCILAPDFFVALGRAFAAQDRPSIIGGRVELGDAGDLPISVVRKDAAARLGREFPGGFLIGANLAFNREVMNRLGGFDGKFGAGGPLRGGEETEWMLRASQCGVPVLYDPSIIIHHFHGRRTKSEARRLYEGYIEGTGGIYAKHLLRDRRVLRWIAGDIRRALRDLVTPTAAPVMGVERLHLFKLRNLVRGLAIYVRARLAK